MFSSSVKFHRLSGVSISGRVISSLDLAMGLDANARCRARAGRVARARTGVAVAEERKRRDERKVRESIVGGMLYEDCLE